MNFYLCEDNTVLHQVYKAKLQELCRKHNIEFHLTIYNSGEELLFDPDMNPAASGILFLDIHMLDINGISAAQQLREEQISLEIIFLTVSKEHFLQAFDVGAFNYLVKNETTDDRFEEVFLKAVQRVRTRQQEYVVLSSQGEYRNIFIKDIRYFEVIQRIITVHYQTNEQFEFFSRIGKLEEQLFGHGFLRVHRSYLTAVSQIEKLTYEKLWLHDGTEIPVGRKYYQDIKSAMLEYAALFLKPQCK